MKIIIVFLLFVCLICPVFSQSDNDEMFRALDDTLGSTLTRSNSNLQNFDGLINDNDNSRTYSGYRTRYNTLAGALKESEARLTRLLEIKDRASHIRAERDNYARLIKRLEELKVDYEDWLKTVQ